MVKLCILRSHKKPAVYLSVKSMVNATDKVYVTLCYRTFLEKLTAVQLLRNSVPFTESGGSSMFTNPSKRPYTEPAESILH